MRMGKDKGKVRCGRYGGKGGWRSRVHDRLGRDGDYHRSMWQRTINEQCRVASLERIARYTVGIAVDQNTGVGTGILVSCGRERYILTAAHVIGDSQPEGLRFWLRPHAPIREKAAISTTDAEVGAYTAGTQLPIVNVSVNKAADVAILKLKDSFCLPDGSDFYDVSRSFEFATWPEQKLDGLSLIVFGFPTDNSRPVFTVGNNTFHFLGCASLVSNYSSDLNCTVWSRISSSFSPKKDFVFDYPLNSEGIGPRGFSGSGVWVLAADPSKLIWKPDPQLIGITHSHTESGRLVATKLTAILEVVPS